MGLHQPDAIFNQASVDSFVATSQPVCGQGFQGGAICRKPYWNSERRTFVCSSSFVRTILATSGPGSSNSTSRTASNRKRVQSPVRSPMPPHPRRLRRARTPGHLAAPTFRLRKVWRGVALVFRNGAHRLMFSASPASRQRVDPPWRPQSLSLRGWGLLPFPAEQNALRARPTRGHRTCTKAAS